MDSSTFFIYYCIGNNKKNIANKTDNIPDAAPTKALKNVDEPRVSSKPSTTKKSVDVEAKTPMKQPHVDMDVPATKNIPEAKASELKKVDADVEKPKSKQVADGEKPPKSEVLDDNPNLKDKELDNFKKYEDDVGASTKKKAKEDANNDLDKGKNHDSKAKALVMARVITEANDRVDTPIPGLLAELTPLKAMKGVKNFKAESRGNGKFEIYLIASKIKLDDYDIDPESEKNDKENDKKDSYEINPKEVWPWKRTSASIAELTEGGGKCEMCARKIQEAIGGDIIKIKDKLGAPGIGAVYNKKGDLISDRFVEHFAVKKGDMIFDRITGPEGMLIMDYKKLFEYGEAWLDFSKIIK